MIQPEEQSMAASVRHLPKDTTGGFEHRAAPRTDRSTGSRCRFSGTHPARSEPSAGSEFFPKAAHQIWRGEGMDQARPFSRREAAFTETAILVRHSGFLESVPGLSLQLGVADHTCHHSNMTKTRCLKKLVSHCTFWLDVKNRHVTSSVARSLQHFCIRNFEQ